MDGDMKAKLVERLRATKRQADAAAFEAGHSAGRSWATDDATEAQLRRLAVFVDDATEADDIAQHVELADQDAYGAAVAVVSVATGNPDADRLDARDFWARLDADPTPDYLAGFIVGAMSVYAEVRDDV